MIALTGSTGKVGRELVAALKSAEAEFKVVARDPMRAAAALGGVSAVAGDFSRPESLAPALEGAETAFLLPPTDPAQPGWERSFVAAAKKAGVRRVVKLSVAGAAKDTPVRIGRWHWEGEEALKASGLAWTMLQPSFFHQNFLGNAQTIKSQGAFYGAMGTGKVSMVDVRDIAAVAAAALTKPGHEGHTYVLATGAHTYVEAAEAFSKGLGRRVSYVDVGPEKAKESMLAAGLPEWYADALLELFAAVRAGHVGETSRDCEAVLGRAPIGLERWVSDFKSAFE
ncbi:MAG: NAD(P)H azoreductase [Elusimicrobia bacterium]|nr:MAG: NAD(P)H azoreductase [Elusimicrobiota bacterium]